MFAWHPTIVDKRVDSQVIVEGETVAWRGWYRQLHLDGFAVYIRIFPNKIFDSLWFINIILYFSNIWDVIKMSVMQKKIARKGTILMQRSVACLAHCWQRVVVLHRTVLLCRFWRVIAYNSDFQTFWRSSMMNLVTQLKKKKTRMCMKNFSRIDLTFWIKSANKKTK